MEARKEETTRSAEEGVAETHKKTERSDIEMDPKSGWDFDPDKRDAQRPAKGMKPTQIFRTLFFSI